MKFYHTSYKISWFEREIKCCPDAGSRRCWGVQAKAFPAYSGIFYDSFTDIWGENFALSENMWSFCWGKVMFCSFIFSFTYIS